MNGMSGFYLNYYYKCKLWKLKGSSDIFAQIAVESNVGAILNQIDSVASNTLIKDIWLCNQSKSFQGDRKCDVETIAN